ncbi:lipoprotein [Chania multitudinisentens RB-25]|uniref:Lipoprotein n=1 Tax=Chania multitudinisentens RB-25 TaxID=1441930 RepID=W0LF98_9GAMM|nr:DUF333 domain-containing protein [Chania multitudinisentens]AHG22543.1 lipoprotein [Chania multitudinisentens RB-25]
MTMAKCLLTGAVLFLAACGSNNNVEPPQEGTSASINMIPTSAPCASVGGVTTIAHNLNGDTLRMCQMPNGKQCEESTLGQGACANAG